MSRSDSPDNQAGITLLEVLLTLVILSLLVSAIALSWPPGKGSTRPGAERALAFIRSAQAFAITGGKPVWLSISHDEIDDGTSVQDLAAGTILGPGEGKGEIENALVLVRADGLLVGPRLRVMTEAGDRELSIWQPNPESVP